MKKNLKRVAVGLGLVGMMGMMMPLLACDMNKKSDKAQTTTSTAEKTKADTAVKADTKTKDPQKKPNS